MNMKKRFKTVDLFAGIGGIRLGFERAGFETVYANDYDANCKVTYDLTFTNPKLTLKDITKKSEKDYSSVLDDVKKLGYDILLGGFPCQAFSIAGYRQGFRDSKGRGNLFFYIAEIIDKTRPEAFMLENVKNLKGHDGGKTYRIIKSTLMKLGYKVTEKVLNAKDYGNIPQTRERIFIVGFRSKRVFNKFRFPEPIPLTKKVSDLLDSKVEDYFYYDGSPLGNKLKTSEIKKGVVYQWRRIYLRENKSGVCPTLTANMGTGGHNVPIIRDDKGIRKLTPRECARIQGFGNKELKLPENIARSQLYKQVGNSVPVPVVQRVAESIKIALEN
jgi:DNA (cytosine-5)-methyltransferase 1